MNQEGIIKALKGLKFSDNDEDRSIWSKSFLISDDVKGYRELLTGELEIPKNYEEDNSRHESIRKNNLLDINRNLNVLTCQKHLVSGVVDLVPYLWFDNNV